MVKIVVKEIRDFLYAMFSDCSGYPSTLRFLSVYVVVSIISVWGVICFMKGELVPIGYDNVALISVAMGIKTAQRVVEQKSPECEKDG